MKDRNLVLTITADQKENINTILRIDPDEVRIPRKDIEILREDIRTMEQCGIMVIITD